MAAGKWKMYGPAKLEMSNKGINFKDDTFTINLYASDSNCYTTLDTSNQLSDLTNQLSTGNGYTQNSKSASLNSSGGTGTVTVDADDVVWTASAAGIKARYAVIYDNTHADDIPCFVCALDTAADVTATAGNTLTITMNASGIITISGATTE